MRTALAIFTGALLICGAAAQTDQDQHKHHGSQTDKEQQHGSGKEHGPSGSIGHPQQGGAGNVQANGPVGPGYHPNGGMTGPNNLERHRGDTSNKHDGNPAQPRDEHGPFGSMGHPQQGGTGNAHANGPVSSGYHPNGDMMGRNNSESMRGGHHDFDRFRGNVTAERRFHAGAWHAPHGYHYQRWTFGQRLPSAYWARNFWIVSFGAYGLMPPPPDAVWVRYGPDALLVDRFTGEIIRVEYDVFY